LNFITSLLFYFKL